MHKIYKAQRRYFDDACKGDSESLRNLFAARADAWQSRPDAFPASRLFADFAAKVKSEVAFKTLIPFAARLALEQTTLLDYECALWLLLRFAECSHTTELPSELEHALPLLGERCEEMGASCQKPFNELLRNYRIERS